MIMPFPSDSLPDFLRKQIHLTKNENVDQGSLLLKTSLWWACDLGHEWEATVSSRLKKQTGCPYCTNRKIWVGFNDLATTHPDLTKDWDYENNSILPSQVSAGSGKKVHWCCSAGHHWVAAVGTRVNLKSGCPECYWERKKALARTNENKPSITVTHPEVSAQWNFQRNSSHPEEFTQGSDYSAQWICDKNHEWEATIYKRCVRNQSCPVCSGRKVDDGFNSLQHKNPSIAAQWHPVFNDELTPQTVTEHSRTRAWWVCDKNHAWNTYIYQRTSKNGSGCPVCSMHISVPELDLFAFLEGLGFSVQRRNRTLLNGKEIDLYVAEKGIGVEFNGLYWHSEPQGKNKTYHYDKWVAAKQAGAQLIQIWEDDWNRNPELIKRMLSHKLGVSQQRTIYGRKTSVIALTKAVAEQFLNLNHIQGYANGSYYLGLQDNEKQELVAVLVLKRDKDQTLNIVRYATSASVVGGFTKLLTHAERIYKPDAFITFADHCVSDGGLYESNGFVADKELPPDYMYVVKGERKHKFGYRLKKFKNDPNLKYEEGLSERELALLNNIPRIWDAGKTRYVKAVTKTLK